MPGLTFRPGDLTGRSDLMIRLVDNKGLPVNPYSITYAIYFVDPGPPEVEVPVGDPKRVPVNPSVGEFYAALTIPTGAKIGTYRIRWTIRQTSGSPVQTVVQEFKVAATVAVVGSMTPGEAQAVWELRVLLRDQCVSGEEIVELDADGVRVKICLADLYDAVADLNPASASPQ